VRLRFLPATPDSGVAFLRTDLPGAALIPARVESVTGTARRTTLGQSPNQVTLVEHVLAALAGMRVDNCLVEIDGPEPPGLDGSSDQMIRPGRGVRDRRSQLNSCPLASRPGRPGRARPR